MNLLDVCKMALEIVAGERIAYDAFPPEDELSIAHDKYVRECEEKLEQAITEAEQTALPEPQHGREPESKSECKTCKGFKDKYCIQTGTMIPCPDCQKVKPLAQYLGEYIMHEATVEEIDALWSREDSFWRDLLEQALEAYESTENVVIKIIKKKAR